MQYIVTGSLTTILQDDLQKYISCPQCRVHHTIQNKENVACSFPVAFVMIGFLDLRKKFTVIRNDTCTKHNDVLRIYCETCNEVICRDCTITDEHAGHDCHPISECYPLHRERLLDHFKQQVKDKVVDLDAAVKCLANREKEVLQQGKQLEVEIRKHSQQLIEQIHKSSTHACEGVYSIVQRKAHLLQAQRFEAERQLARLTTCEEVTEHILNKCSQRHMLTERVSISKNIEIASHNVNSKVFEPLENADMKFRKAINEGGIGIVIGSVYGQATLRIAPALSLEPTVGVLSLKADKEGGPFNVLLSAITCSLGSRDGHELNCTVSETNVRGEYMIAYTQTSRHDGLTVRVGGVDVLGKPFPVDIREMNGTPFSTITCLDKPWGVGICGISDCIVVAENNSHCVSVFTMAGKRVRSFGREGTRDGEFTAPRGVTITDDGHVLVTDMHRLQKLTLNGACVKSIGSSKSGTGQKQFSYPTGMACHCTTKQIYVADSDNNRIRVLSSDLTPLYTISQYGNNQTFNAPYDITLDDEGDHIYVAQWGNHCITKLTTTGQFVTSFGSKGKEYGLLEYPTSIVYSKKLLFVTEWGNDRVSIFDRDGNFLHCFGGKSGQVELKKPYAIATDTLGNVYISDFNNDRVILC